MGQQVLNKDSNEVKRFIEVMEGISKMLNANSLIYRTYIRREPLYYRTRIIKGSQNNQKEHSLNIE